MIWLECDSVGCWYTEVKPRRSEATTGRKKGHAFFWNATEERVTFFGLICIARFPDLRVHVGLFTVLCHVETSALVLGIGPQGHDRASSFSRTNVERRCNDRREDGDHLYRVEQDCQTEPVRRHWRFLGATPVNNARRSADPVRGHDVE